jgi:signal transduction histidine kinase
MSLRRRLTLVLLLTAAPLVGGLVWLRAEMQQLAAVRALREITQFRVEAIGKERCEAAPQELERLGPRPFERAAPPPGERGWPAPRDFPRGDGPPPFGALRGTRPRPPDMYAYDSAFQAADPAAPAFPSSLRSRLGQGSDSASAVERLAGERYHLIALRTHWPDGRCAFVLARWSPPSRLPRESGFIASAIALCGVLVAAVWIAAGSVIRRIRALEREVRRAAASRYAEPVAVEGGDEVASLARAFNAAGAEVRAHVTQVEQREEALRSFLANTTHDVMIPLTVLQGHLSSMRRRLEEGGRVAAMDIAAASEEAGYLGSLVHNLGAAAKLDAGEGIVRRDPVDLGALVERVVERHRPLAVPRDVEIVFAVPPDAPVRVLGDITLIEQALGNIVANAVRYNNAGGHVAVSLESPRSAPGCFQLRVVDDGPGVSPEELPRLGERQFRGEAARSARQDGLGLGLHIARVVAKRHGFALVFSSPEAGGLEVRIEGPLLAEPPA